MADSKSVSLAPFYLLNVLVLQLEPRNTRISSIVKLANSLEQRTLALDLNTGTLSFSLVNQRLKASEFGRGLLNTYQIQSINPNCIWISIQVFLIKK